MRVITGLARGRTLVTLPGEDTRPTASRVKEGVFSAIQFDIEGRRVLDLFAGSGALGIEALSRGAAHAVFIDNSAEAVAVVRENLKHTGLEAAASVQRTDFASYLAMCRDTFDLCFVDPPYAAGYYEKVFSLLLPRMSEHGRVIAEHPTELTLPDAVGGWSVYRTYRYGKVAVTIYQKDGENR